MAVLEGAWIPVHCTEYRTLTLGVRSRVGGPDKRDRTGRKICLVLRTSELGFQCFSSFQRGKKKVALMSLDQGAPGQLHWFGAGGAAARHSPAPGG